MHAVLHLFGFMLAGLAAIMFLPVFMGLLLHEYELCLVFMISSAITTFIAGGLIFSSWNDKHQLKRHDAFQLMLVMWTGVPLFIAIPFYLSGCLLSPSEAYFESVAGFTTTGATLFTQVENIPRTLLFWRGLVDWLGGLATLGMIFLVLSPVQLGGLRGYLSPMIGGGAARSLRADLIAIRWIPLLYSSLTIMCFLLLMIIGLPPLEAIGFAFSALSTSGFNPTGRAMSSFAVSAQIIVGLFVFLGATSVLWQYTIFMKRWYVSCKYETSYEIYWFLLLLVICGVFLTLIYAIRLDLEIFSALGTGMLSAISLMSTSGLEVRDGGFALFPLPLLLFMVIIGGAGFSTAGGIKIFRLGIMFIQARWELRRLVYPHGKHRIYIGDRIYDMQLLKAIWLVFLSFIIVAILGEMSLTATGMNFEMSLVAAITNLANAGSIYSSLVSDMSSWITYAEMKDTARFILSFLMILGRMEVLGFLVLFNLFFWRS